jgi:hypothetical protein
MPNESDEFDELLENLHPNFGSSKPLKEQLVDSSAPYTNGGEKEVSISIQLVFSVVMWVPLKEWSLRRWGMG